MMTVLPPVVQPSLGEMALMQGMAAVGYRPGYRAETEMRHLKYDPEQVNKTHNCNIFPRLDPVSWLCDHVWSCYEQTCCQIQPTVDPQHLVLEKWQPTTMILSLKYLFPSPRPSPEISSCLLDCPHSSNNSGYTWGRTWERIWNRNKHCKELRWGWIILNCFLIVVIWNIRQQIICNSIHCITLLILIA